MCKRWGLYVGGTHRPIAIFEDEEVEEAYREAEELTRDTGVNHFVIRIGYGETCY